MTVKEIVIEYLKKNGYSGLCGDYCGCEIDDLAPCDNNMCDCVCGYKIIITEENKEKYSDVIGECGLNVGDFIISKEKESK